jgi:hypothetical protein
LARATVTIPSRFNGPPTSANGGYSCGLVARLVGAEDVTVSLRLPPPIDTPLAVVRDGDRVELRDGEELVAEGEHWCDHHPFPTCFTCGPERAPGDGLRLFPGELDGGLFATAWTPDASLDDGTGHVRSECVWAALDCPTSAPVANFATGPPMVLARLTARLGCRVIVGKRHAIVAWPLAIDGRKHHAACALFDSEGRLLCASQALWIELRRE